MSYTFISTQVNLEAYLSNLVLTPFKKIQQAVNLLISNVDGSPLIPEGRNRKISVTSRPA